MSRGCREPVRVEKYFPGLIFVSVTPVRLTMVVLVYLETIETTRIKFQSGADDALNCIECKVEFDLALLHAIQAMFTA